MCKESARGQIEFCNNFCDRGYFMVANIDSVVWLLVVELFGKY